MRFNENALQATYGVQRIIFSYYWTLLFALLHRGLLECGLHGTRPLYKLG